MSLRRCTADGRTLLHVGGVQVVMAVFSYLYFNSYVAAEAGVTVGGVLSAAMQLGAHLLWPCRQPLLSCEAPFPRLSGSSKGRKGLSSCMQLQAA